METGKLRKVGPDYYNIFKLAANQIMMMQIIELLNEVNAKLEIIIQGQHDDRISKIEGAVNHYNSLSAPDRLNKDRVDSIVSPIYEGIASLKREIRTLFTDSDPHAKFRDNWPSLGKNKGDKNKVIENNHRIISEDINWIIKGYGVLIEWDVNFNTNNENIKEFISFIENGKWEELRQFARALPYKKNSGGIFPEEVWGNLYERKDEIMGHMNNLLKNNHTEINEYVISADENKFLEVFNEL